MQPQLEGFAAPGGGWLGGGCPCGRQGAALVARGFLVSHTPSQLGLLVKKCMLSPAMAAGVVSEGLSTQDHRQPWHEGGAVPLKWALEGKRWFDWDNS